MKTPGQIDGYARKSLAVFGLILAVTIVLSVISPSESVDKLLAGGFLLALGWLLYGAAQRFWRALRLTWPAKRATWHILGLIYVVTLGFVHILTPYGHGDVEIWATWQGFALIGGDLVAAYWAHRTTGAA